MLRHNSDLKSWYRLYARKIEATKTEESFCMTLRQIWRFLRDCQVPGHDATLANFDRIYNQGKKNHFTLLGTKEVAKFNLMYGLHGKDGSDHFAKFLSKQGENSDFEEEEDEGQEEEADICTKLGIKPEDVHGPARIVL